MYHVLQKFEVFEVVAGFAKMCPIETKTGSRFEVIGLECGVLKCARTESKISDTKNKEKMTRCEFFLYLDCEN